MMSAPRTVEKRWLMSRAVRPARAPEGVEDLGLGLGIQGARRLVEHDNRGVPVESPGQRDLLPLPDTQILALLEKLAQPCFVAVGRRRMNASAPAAGGALDPGRSGLAPPPERPMFSRTVI